jgi:hypothetical protein
MKSQGSPTNPSLTGDQLSGCGLQGRPKTSLITTDQHTTIDAAGWLCFLPAGSLVDRFHEGSTQLPVQNALCLMKAHLDVQQHPYCEADAARNVNCNSRQVVGLPRLAQPLGGPGNRQT